jgi:hypothetical protein
MSTIFNPLLVPGPWKLVAAFFQLKVPHYFILHIIKSYVKNLLEKITLPTVGSKKEVLQKAQYFMDAFILWALEPPETNKLVRNTTQHWENGLTFQNWFQRYERSQSRQGLRKESSWQGKQRFPSASAWTHWYLFWIENPSRQVLTPDYVFYETCLGRRRLLKPAQTEAWKKKVLFYFLHSHQF